MERQGPLFEKTGRPLKRTRTQPEDDSRVFDEWIRHPTLYMDHGNIVLLAESTVFKVQRELLSKYSSVFLGLPAFTRPLPSDIPLYDNCSFLPVPDGATDFAYFLTALLHFDSFPGPGNLLTADPTSHSFPALAATLRLAIAYKVTPLCERAIGWLHYAYPADYRNATSTESLLARRRVVFGNNENAPDPVTVVNLCRDCKVNVVLPFAFYEICTKGLSTIAYGVVQDDTMIRLSQDDASIAMLGWQELQRAHHRILRETFFAENLPECPTWPTCSQHNRIYILERQLEVLRDGLDGSVVLKAVLVRDYYEEACATCQYKWESLADKQREELWDKLPSIFGLRSWEELLKEVPVEYIWGASTRV